MAHVIAMAGKGGVGKTTICGMFIEYLCEKKNGPVLAVDADANSNLNEVLGVEVQDTLGDIREDMTRAEMAVEQVIPKGMTKADYAEMRFSDALTEADDFDLLVMGRTQGKGCYCFVNGLLTSQVAKYAQNYRYIVVDNEAGLEHLSRGVLPQVDTILLVSDCSRRGVQAAGRLSEMIVDLKLGAKEVGLIINRAPGGELSPGVREEIDKYGMKLYDTGDGRNGGALRSNGGVSNDLQNIQLNRYINEGNAMMAGGFLDFNLYKGLKLTLNGNVALDETRGTEVQNPFYGQFA